MKAFLDDVSCGSCLNRGEELSKLSHFAIGTATAASFVAAAHQISWKPAPQLLLATSAA
jgi:hypothetical protein